MDDILTELHTYIHTYTLLRLELNLETLAAVFRREIFVASIVQSMSNEKIERLGVLRL